MRSRDSCWRAIVLAAASTLGGAQGIGCSDQGAFVCDQDAACGPTGTCESTGWCSFPDSICPSAARYGDHAGGLSGTCVDVPIADGSTGSDPSTTTDDGQSSTGASEGSGDSTGSSAVAFEITDDDLEGEFGAGTFMNTAWTGDRVALTSNLGSFTSRVMDGGGVASWTALSWVAGAPYGMPLPDGAATESGYASGGISMSANVLLLHLDEPAFPEGAVVLDSSGQSAAGEVRGLDAMSTAVDGRFGGALGDAANAYVAIAGSGSFDFQVDDFTWSLWFSGIESCPGNHVYMGIEGEGVSRSHLWIGCRQATGAGCSDAGDRTVVGGTLRSDHASADGVNLCGSTPVNDGQWHHLALIKVGHENASVGLYLDGELEVAMSGGFNQPIAFDAGTEFAVGAFSGGSFGAAGSFDEVTVWRRALLDSEITELYRRGVQRLELQARTCATEDCAEDPPWVGSSPTQGFVGAGLSPGQGVELPGLQPARYFQYRADFANDGGLTRQAPDLFAVTVSGLRE